MARSKRNQLTVADYAVVALCPSLIVLLLASLVYFVVLCVYHGQYSSRLGYIWFMFILGAVGIARISIEQSRGYATGYAAVLGLATFVVLSRFQTLTGPAAALSPLVNAMLIATVWFLADRITFDCTLIDDDKDASGQGLLDGLSSRDGGATGAAAGFRSRRRRGRQPGRTVLWLTAAALPLFGVGQFLLRSDPQLQRGAMFALAVYLFAALSLLVATSFLGVRRYLRQREVDMPPNVSAAWLGGGVLMTALILAVCFALPQPGRMLANFELPASLQSADWLSPSRYGWGSEGADPGEKPSASSSAQGEAEQPSQGAGGQEPGQSDSGQQDSGEQGSQQSDGEQSGGEQSSRQSGGQQSRNQQSSEQQSGGQQSGDQPTGEQQSGDQQSGSQQTSGSNSQQSQSDQQSGQPSSTDPPQSGDDSNSNDPASQSQQDQPSSNGERRDEPSESSPDAAEQQQADSPPAQSSTAQSPPASSPLSQLVPSLSGIIKGLIYLILLAILAAFLWMQRAALADFWRQLMAWLAGRGPAPTAATAQPQPVQVSNPPRPFASYSNPLHAGADPRRAVIETFQAAEAWYREQGQPRRMDETPHEYALRLRGIEAEDRQALLRLTDAYNQIVYGGGGASQRDLQCVQSVWQSFRIKAPLQS